MAVINWMLSKAMGLPTIDKNCSDRVLVFLTKHNIDEPTFSFVNGERSETNRNFFQRVYIGRGRRKGADVAFILDVNEDIPRPRGALIDANKTISLKDIRQEWLDDCNEMRRELGMPDFQPGTLFTFALKKAGGPLESLEDL